MHFIFAWLLPCWERVCGGLCSSATTGLLWAGVGAGAGLRWCGCTQGILTRRGATTAAAAGNWGPARRRGWRRRVMSHAPTTVLQPVWCQLSFVWQKTERQKDERHGNMDRREMYCQKASYQLRAQLPSDSFEPTLQMRTSFYSDYIGIHVHG